MTACDHAECPLDACGYTAYVNPYKRKRWKHRKLVWLFLALDSCSTVYVVGRILWRLA